SFLNFNDNENTTLHCTVEICYYRTLRCQKQKFYQCGYKAKNSALRFEGYVSHCGLYYNYNRNTVLTLKQ
ncbi:hypothetical protein, partial [Bartonella sp. AA5SXTY]|uniref:hypothetical protein n=1 Tax=Bartonella sp. AA5SXTY TaxID=3243435 RepID=UPI0035CFB758